MFVRKSTLACGEVEFTRSNAEWFAAKLRDGAREEFLEWSRVGGRDSVRTESEGSEVFIREAL